MPGSLDGFGLARRLRGRHPELPIILTSGNAARPDDMDGALFLPKPYDHQGLLQTIRSEEHTSELQSLMRISYAVFCLKKKKNIKHKHVTHNGYIDTQTTVDL